MFVQGHARCCHPIQDCESGILHSIGFSFRQIQTEYRALSSWEPFWWLASLLQGQVRFMMTVVKAGPE